jgi:HAD superfamily hydrolase (TIGR01509 family)
MIKAIIFDCFGVIIADALQAMNDELSKHDPAAANRVGDIVKATNRGEREPAEANMEIAAIFGLDLEDYRASIVDGEVKDQRLLDYILSLKPAYKTAMLSNISKGGISKRFTPDELKTYFDSTVFSGEVGFAKPEARAYETVVDLLGVRLDECVFTDDRQPYIVGAQAVGMQTILYTDFDQFKTDLEKLLSPLET